MLPKWVGTLHETYQKVRDKADDIRHNVVVHAVKAKENLFLGKAKYANQLEKQLEHHATSISSPHQLDETIRRWNESIAACQMDDCPRYRDVSDVDDSFRTNSSESPATPRTSTDSGGERFEEARSPLGGKVTPESGMTYFQVFLRSRALELCLETIALNKQLREHILNHLEDEEKASPKQQLQELIAYCCRSDEKVHREILWLVLTAEGLCKTHLDHIVKIVGLLKHDWMENRLFDQRQHLSRHAEKLRDALRHAVSGVDVDGEENALTETPVVYSAIARHRKIAENSRMLFEILEVTESNTLATIGHRKCSRASAEAALDDLSNQVTRSESMYRSLMKSNDEMRTNLQTEIDKSGDTLEKEIAALEATLAALDDQKAGLEAKITGLQAQLNEVEGKAHNARMRRAQLQNESKSQLVKLLGKLDTEKKFSSHTRQNMQDIQNIETLTENASSLLRELLARQAELIEHSHKGVDTQVKESLKRYLMAEKDRFVYYKRVIVALIEAIKKEPVGVPVAAAEAADPGKEDQASAEGTLDGEEGSAAGEGSADAVGDAVKLIPTPRLESARELRSLYHSCCSEIDDSWRKLHGFLEKHRQQQAASGATSASQSPSAGQAAGLEMDAATDKLEKELVGLYEQIKEATATGPSGVLHAS
eukprot:GHVU01189680.1.p1 GENE.GHVU01189680.1~~GHVU01189680.1.p1  ORF type:complete len:653 (+),score=112.97 GHVU01189680.1:165-2123(+)